MDALFRVMLASRQRCLAHFERRNHREHASDILCPGATPLLLRTTEQQRMHAAFRRAFQKANSFGPTKLVRATTHEITIAHTVGGQFANPLRSVAKERHFPLARKR